jgi:hypothetical protein
MEQDARIEDVLTTLSNPVDFVRGIVGSFIEGKFDRDQAIVRIGVSGIGVAPHYCIEQGRTVAKGLGSDIAAYERRMIFHGRSHKSMLDDQCKGLSWSSSTATFEEVQSLLGRLRANKRVH